MSEKTTDETMAGPTDKPNIATMMAYQLEAHIETLEATHKRLLTTLRALARARAAEEAAA